jgi:oligopeptide/dipeptide ABC transporter ATP-binding protein
VIGDPANPHASERTGAQAAPVLEIRDLSTGFSQGDSEVLAVDGVSFDVFPGETLAVVGESGSGKSVTMLSVMRLLDGANANCSGSLSYRDRDGRCHDLAQATERSLRNVRGGEIAMIFQDAGASLDPLVTVGEQIAETVRLHRGLTRRQSWAEALRLLEKVGIAAPERRSRDYPHQLSGGMRQRVMIAIGLAGEPQLLIADEPTTALDVTIQAQILELLKNVQSDRGLSIVFVTHDLGIVSEIADRMIVMYAGQIVESGSSSHMMTAPRHPYSAALLACLPRLVNDEPQAGLGEFRRARPGTVPVVGRDFRGCRFRNRCALAREACSNDVPLIETGPGWLSRCFFWGEAA